ncbi:MAG: hypothetical protein AAB420_03505 [Patescibacteria group bacterium]
MPSIVVAIPAKRGRQLGEELLVLGEVVIRHLVERSQVPEAEDLAQGVVSSQRVTGVEGNPGVVVYMKAIILRLLPRSTRGLQHLPKILLDFHRTLLINIKTHIQIKNKPKEGLF